MPPSFGLSSCVVYVQVVISYAHGRHGTPGLGSRGVIGDVITYTSALTCRWPMALKALLDMPRPG